MIWLKVGDLKLENELEDFLKKCKERVERDFDCTIAIKGESNYGMSALANQISYYLVSERHKFKIIDLRGKNKKEINKEMQDFIRLSETEVWSRTQATIITDDIEKIPENFLNFRVDFILKVVNRGIAKVYIKKVDRDAVKPSFQQIGTEIKFKNINKINKHCDFCHGLGADCRDKFHPCCCKLSQRKN